MAVLKEQKAAILKKFRRSELDCGSTEVQIALLTAKINELTKHFETHAKDHHGKRGLITAVNQRRKLLNYLFKTDAKKYSTLIKELDIRK